MVPSVYPYVNQQGTRYYLHSKDVLLKNIHRMQRIYYFSKVSDDALTQMPEGYEVIENSRSGLPFLKTVR